MLSGTDVFKKYRVSCKVFTRCDDKPYMTHLDVFAPSVSRATSKAKFRIHSYMRTKTNIRNYDYDIMVKGVREYE